MQLRLMACTVALKESELENARLKQEVQVRRLLGSMGLSDANVTFDLDAGIVRVARASAPT